MSTMKKVISLMLCVAMLIGTFAIVGNVALVASAEELSGAPLEGTNIDSYESLVAQYGGTDENGVTNGFIYVGAEVVESNGKITDGFVKPGDVLTVRLYVKSNMYTGAGIMFLAFDNKFFDVKLPAGADASVDANGYTSNYDGGYINATHPMVAPNGMTHKITSITLKNAGGWVKNCGFTDTYLAETDIINSQNPYDVTIASGEPYKMTSDEYLLSYEVKVKEGLEDGIKGVIDSPINLWQAYINPKNGKHHAGMQGYIPAKLIEEGLTFDKMNVKMSTQMDNGVLDTFILDATHTLEIGEGEATTYTAKFYAENQTDVISTDDTYNVGDAVEFPATVENQIGWAIVREGVTAPGTVLYPAEDGTYSYTMKEADVDFLRILSIDKFPVKFSVSQETLPGPVDPETGRPTVIYSVTVNEDKLPEGMTFIEEEWAIQIDLPIGQPFDLASIPEDAVVKVGSEITGWDTTTVAPPSTIEGTVITLNAVNGAMGSDITVSSKAIWNPELYTVNFYLNEEAYKNKTPLKTLEGLSYGSAANYNGVDAETGKIYNINGEVADKKFAGWVDADTGEILSTADNIKLIYDKDLELYAAWSDYKNSAVFMVRDYENGEGWVEYKRIIDRADGDTATITATDMKNILAGACADENVNLQYIFTTDPDKIADGKYTDYTVKGVLQTAPGAYAVPPETKYSGNQVYYIATTISSEVTWKAPAYDEKTNTFDETNATVISTEKVATAVHTGAGDPYAVSSKLTKTPDAPTGYVLSGWKDAETGEAVKLNADGAYTLSSGTRSATLIATYDLVKYPVAFNLRNGATPDVVMLEGTVTLGGSIEIKGAKFTLNGKASALPEIGLDNSKQPDGGYTLPEGYKFAGWTLGFGADATEAKFPVKLTADMIRKNFANGALQFNATWEAQEYTLTFYITNAVGEEEVFNTYKVKAGEEIATYKNVTAEIAAAVNAKAPEGKTFSQIWYNKETNATDTVTKMPAKDVGYYAVYGTSTISVYVDYNFLAEKDLNQTMQLFKNVALLYGADIAEVKEEDPYFNRSFETVVKRTPITLKPEDPSEVIGWNIYHVAPGEDPFTAEWKSGVNDDGSTIATTTIIFQPIWKAHKDMLIRVYDTDGNIAHAIGKDLKTYFWNNGEIVGSAKETAINRNTDFYLAYILTMSIENWDWSEFFNIEMWQSITLRFDPFPIPRSWLTWEGFKGLMEAIGNALGSLF